MPNYSHTQKAPLCLVLYSASLGFFVIAWIVRDLPVIPWIMLVVGFLNLLVALAFQHLTVQDNGESLAVRFGPLPLFHTTIPYADIKKVEIGRTMLIDGLGIHMSMRGGWVWNIWGRDCVVVHRRNGVIRIGTNDAGTLAQFLQEKTGQKQR